MSKTYKTLRLYNNGSVVTNLVQEEHISGHIEYNAKSRPGCALFVDGRLMHSGYPSPQMEQEIIDNWHTFTFPNQITLPYN